MKITDEMAEIAARILNKRLAEGNLFGVSRDMLEAALAAAPTSAASDHCYAEIIRDLEAGVAVKDKEDGSGAWEYDVEATNKTMMLASIYLTHLTAAPASAAEPVPLDAFKAIEAESNQLRDLCTKQRNRAEVAEKALTAMRKRYEDWRPITEPPHYMRQHGTLLEFYTPGTDEEADPDTWRTATWEERPEKATHWCLIVTPLGPRDLTIDT